MMMKKKTLMRMRMRMKMKKNHSLWDHCSLKVAVEYVLAKLKEAVLKKGVVA